MELFSAKVFLKAFHENFPMFEPRDADWLHISGIYDDVPFFLEVVTISDGYAIVCTADLNPPKGTRKTKDIAAFIEEVSSVEKAENRPYRLIVTPNANNPKNISVFQTWLIFDFPYDFADMDEFLDIVKQSNVNIQNALLDD